MKAGEPPQHIIYWAPADWLTSRVRSRSAMAGDPLLRTVYFELLNVLYANGGEVTSDPAGLADLLLLPAKDVDRCLPILRDLGSITVEDGVVRQPRVTKEIERYHLLSGKRRRAALARWQDDEIPKKGRATWLTPYGEAWQRALGGEPPWTHIAKEFKGPHDRLGGDAVLAGWTRYLANTEGRFASASAFAKKIGLWVKAPPPAPLPRPQLPRPDGRVMKRWVEARERIEMPPHLKATWLSPVRGQSIAADGTLTLIAPSKAHADAVRRYEAKIMAAYNDAEHHDDAPAVRLVAIVEIPEDAGGLHGGGL